MARLQKLLALVGACLVLLVAFGNFQADAHCNIMLFRSIDKETLLIHMNDRKYIYLRLKDKGQYPAIMYFVDGNSVTIFDKEARPSFKSFDSQETTWDHDVLRQFWFHARQFDTRKPALELNGHSLKRHKLVWWDKFQIHYPTNIDYLINLTDVPNFELAIKESQPEAHYEIKCPLADLETRIDHTCQVEMFRQGDRVYPQSDPVSCR